MDNESLPNVPEGLELPVASDTQLQDIRSTATRCRALLQKLAKADELSAQTDTEAIKQLTAFNIWAANVGVFRPGQQSLAARIKSLPETSASIQQFLLSLEANLEKKLREDLDDNGNSSGEETDASSDRSSVVDKPVITDEDSDDGIYLANGKTWMSIHSTITSLRQIGIRLHRGGARHRQERISRFIGIDKNKQIYELFEHLALQKVINLFPNASATLQKRIATSIARRRAKFLYLERHQMKLRAIESEQEILRQPPQPNTKPVQQQQPVPEQQNLWGNVPPSASLAISSIHQQTQISATIATKMEIEKRPESVSSVRILTGQLPSLPNIDRSTMSFTCPYCFLVCPSTEASSASAWRQHLIRDLEPFFCIFDDCDDPFTCGQSYASWISHIKKKHIQPKWCCWYCPSSTPDCHFLSSLDLKHHLQVHHSNQVTEQLMDTALEHSKAQVEPLFRGCAFCGGYPDDIEARFADPTSLGATQVLEAHIRNHLDDIALLLLPVNMDDTAPNQKELDSEADRDNRSEQNMDNLNALDGLSTAVDLQCPDTECDCHTTPSILGGSWSVWELPQWKLTGVITPTQSTYDPVYREYSDTAEWEFWYPKSLGPFPMTTYEPFPKIEDDAMLHQLFNITTPAKDSIPATEESASSFTALLEALKTPALPDGPSYEWYKASIPEAAPNSCDWLESCEPIAKWKRGELNHLVVAGDAGCGKSVLTKYLVDSITAPCCYFFLSGDKAMNGRHVLTFILRQLLHHFADMLSGLITERIQTDTDFFEIEFQCDILELCISFADLPTTFIVLDGVDEARCGHTIYSRLKKLMKLENSRFRFLTTISTRSTHSSVPFEATDTAEILDLSMNPSFAKATAETFWTQLTVFMSEMEWPVEVCDIIYDTVSSKRLFYLFNHLFMAYLASNPFKMLVASGAAWDLDIPYNMPEAIELIIGNLSLNAEIFALLSCLIISNRPISFDEALNVLTSTKMASSVSDTEALDILRKGHDIRHIELLRYEWSWILSCHDGWISIRHATLTEELRRLFRSKSLTYKDDVSANLPVTFRIAFMTATYLNMFNKFDMAQLTECNFLHFLSSAAGILISTFSMHQDILLKNPFLRDLVLPIFKVNSVSFQTWFPVYREKMGKMFQTPIEPYHDLIIATYFDNLDMVESCLVEGHNLENADGNGRTALSWAVAVASDPIIDRLCEHGTDINTQDNNGATPLIIAIQKGRISIVKRLISLWADLNIADIKSRTPLMHAVIQKNVDLTNTLLNYSADISKSDHLGQTALMHAVIQENVDLTNTLLNYGADISKSDHLGQTALMHAVIQKNVDLTNTLLNYGADIDEGDHLGQTALIHAVIQKSVEIVKALLDAGADIDESDDLGQAALIHAVNLSHLEMAEVLISQGAQDEIEDVNKQTALSIAVEMDNPDMVTILLQMTANFPNAEHRTRALWLAATLQREHLVLLLIERGTSVDFLDAEERGDFDINNYDGTERISKLLQQAYVRKYADGESNRTFLRLDSRVPYNHDTEEEKSMQPDDIDLERFNSALFEIEAAEKLFSLKGSRGDVFATFDGHMLRREGEVKRVSQYIAARILCLDETMPSPPEDRLAWLKRTAQGGEQLTSEDYAASLLVIQHWLVNQHRAKNNYFFASRVASMMLTLNRLDRNPTSNEHCTMLVILALFYREDGEHHYAIAILRGLLSLLPRGVTEPAKMEILRAAIKDAEGVEEEVRDAIEMLDANRMAILHILMATYCHIDDYAEAWGILREIVSIAAERSRMLEEEMVQLGLRKPLSKSPTVEYQ